MVFGKDQVALRVRLEERAREYVRWMESSSTPAEWSAWLEDLRSRGALIEHLTAVDAEVAPLALFAHA